jgi:hypothetical protein
MVIGWYVPSARSTFIVDSDARLIMGGRRCPVQCRLLFLTTPLLARSNKRKGKDTMSAELVGRRLLLGGVIGALAAPRAQADTSFTNFRFPATGASAARTMPDRLAEIKNVKDFGAVGDGRSDDTAAIQAALDAAFGSSASPTVQLVGLRTDRYFSLQGYTKSRQRLPCAVSKAG